MRAPLIDIHGWPTSLTLQIAIPKMENMRSRSEQQDSIESEGYKELQVLSEVESSPEITQRQLAQRAGIALGLTNALLRNMIKKGYIRANKASWKRWVYALTPEGATFKLRLVKNSINQFLDQYRIVRQILRDQLQPLTLHEESRIAILGTGDFARLVYLGIKEFGIEEIDVFSAGVAVNQRFLGMVVQDVSQLHAEIMPGS